MKNINFKLNKLLILFALIAAFSVFGITVAASEVLDLDENGSISITFTDNSTKEPVPSGTVELFHIAEISNSDADLYYVLTDEFSASDISLTDLKDKASTIASALRTYQADNNLKGVTATANSNGICTFDNLELGVYLAVQTLPADGYYAVLPFIITVPVTDEAGNYVYDVDATPKMDKVNAVPSSSTPSSTPSSSKPSTDDETQGKDDENLPQTGQLNWPIPALAGAGILLFFLGWALTFSKKKKNV